MQARLILKVKIVTHLHDSRPATFWSRIKSRRPTNHSKISNSKLRGNRMSNPCFTHSCTNWLSIFTASRRITKNSTSTPYNTWPTPQTTYSCAHIKIGHGTIRESQLVTWDGVRYSHITPNLQLQWAAFSKGTTFVEGLSTCMDL